MPRKLTYWCAIRVAAHATQGQWSNQIVPDLTALEALKRWDGGKEVKQQPWAIRLRLRLLLPFSCRWNAWVRDFTACIERHTP